MNTQPSTPLPSGSSPEARPQPGVVPLLMNATRFPYLTAILVPVLVGGAVALHDGYVNLPLLFVTLLAVALF